MSWVRCGQCTKDDDPERLYICDCCHFRLACHSCAAADGWMIPKNAMLHGGTYGRYEQMYCRSCSWMVDDDESGFVQMEKGECDLDDE